MKYSRCSAVLFSISLALFLSQVVEAHTDSEITNSVQNFRDSLSQQQRAKALLSFDDPARTNWTNLPIGLAARPGISVKELSSESRIRLHDLLMTLLSSQGYLKVTSIINLDDILNQVYANAYQEKAIDDETYEMIKNLKWDYENYFVSLWGSPSDSKPWGLKFEGHHISINLSSNGSNISVTPFFLGSDPAEIVSTKYAGLRVLSKEEDYGFLLINSLNDKQKKLATLSKAVPEDIITNPTSPQRLEDIEGIAASQFGPQQRSLLRRLLSEYINNLEYAKRQEYWDKINNTGFDLIHFAWIGSYERNKPHYYIIHSRDFIIEYDNISWDKKGADHIHTIWREKGNDFGEDILRAHYQSHDHKKGKH
jgi:hypothetical protein